MKRFIFFILLIYTFSGVAQKRASLVFFTSDKSKFTVISDSVKINATAKSKVKLDSLFEQSYEIKIIFENNDEISARIYPKRCFQVSYVIRIGDFERKLLWFGEKKIQNCNVSKNESAKNETADAYQKNCNGKMSVSDFNSLKKLINNTDLESDKLKVAKTAISKTCITSRQARTLASLFDFEETKISFAKFAHERVIDKQKFSMINDVFNFASSIRKLNEYFKAKGK